MVPRRITVFVCWGCKFLVTQMHNTCRRSRERLVYDQTRIIVTQGNVIELNATQPPLDCTPSLHSISFRTTYTYSNYLTEKVVYELTAEDGRAFKSISAAGSCHLIILATPLLFFFFFLFYYPSICLPPLPSATFVVLVWVPYIAQPIIFILVLVMVFCFFGRFLISNAFTPNNTQSSMIIMRDVVSQHPCQHIVT